MGSLSGDSRGQGATEYLVLLGAVMIIGLATVALVTFLPIDVSEAKRDESLLYWRSASPVSIVEWGAAYHPSYPDLPEVGAPYVRIRNNGNYPITITKVLAGNEWVEYVDGRENGSFVKKKISDLLYLAPGSEGFIGSKSYFYSLPEHRNVLFAACGPKTNECCLPSHPLCTDWIRNIPQSCRNNSGTDFGYMVVKDFGFEYIAHIEGQQITKKEVGAIPVIIKCTYFPLVTPP